MAVLCPLNTLNEVCDGSGGTGCETILFSPGCGCAPRSSGCDGYVCFQLYDNSNGEACPCDNISLNAFQINFAGSGVNNYCSTNCDGFCTIRVQDCGPATYLMNQGSNCYELTSGIIFYQSSGLGVRHDCQRFYDIPLTPKNPFCDTATTTVTAYDYTSHTVNETDNSISIDVSCGGTNFCGGPDAAIRPNQGIQVSKAFCTHCDKCDYVLELTFDENAGLFGSASIDSTNCTVTGTPFPATCVNGSYHGKISGTINRGSHAFAFYYYVIGELVEFPPCEATCTFTLTNCRNNDCEYCTCTILDKFNTMKFDWYDACTGILQSYAPIRFSGTLTDMGDPYCLWRTPTFASPTVNSGTRSTRFEAVCFGGCCEPYPDFPIKPASLAYGTTYLYEFYTFSGLPTYDSDYYIWASNQETPCTPADFNRVWHKCDGVVNPSCTYYFKIETTGCLDPCNTCEGCFTLYGEENSRPVKNKQFKIWDDCAHIDDPMETHKYAGSTDEFGRACFTLPSGQEPWCLEVLGGGCYESGIFSPIYCAITEFPLATATGCIVHSGICTLCEGQAISKELPFSDTFRNGVLQYDTMTSEWYSEACRLLEVNYCNYNDISTGCVCATSGYFKFATWLKCEHNDWKLTLKLPYRSCECSGCIPLDTICSGVNCHDRDYAVEYTEPSCNLLYPQHTGCLPSITLDLYASSGDFTLACNPSLDIGVSFNMRNEQPCNALLYNYNLDITE